MKKTVTRLMTLVMAVMLVFAGVFASTSTVEAATKPTKVTLNSTKRTMYIGQKYTLKVKSVTPENASKSVNFKSSNSKVATVTSKGVVQAKKTGTANITVSSKVNSKVKATFKVTVKQQVKKITLAKTKVTLVAGKSYTLKAKSISPSNAASKKLTFKSSNTKVAKVTSAGKITGVKGGTAKITVAAADKAGAKATCTVTVTNVPVKSVKLNKTSATINIRYSTTLKATVSPSNATIKTVTWKSSNTKVATVSSTGKVTGKAKGTAKITATTKSGSKKATCTVTVKSVAVKGVKLNKTTASVNVGSSTTLKATVSPTNASVNTVTWKSEDTKIATVSSAGKVTGKKAGKVKITATTKSGAKKATCTVTVKNVAVSGVKLNKTATTINVGKTETLKATVSPSNATDKTVTWASSNTAVATVSSTGVVTAKAAGTATITVTTKSGAKKASCTVTVPNPVVDVTGVTLDTTSAKVRESETVVLTATVLPANATNKNVTWTTSNAAVATVDAGKVTAVAEGTATITATSNNGKTAVATVEVLPKKENAKAEGSDYAFNFAKDALGYEVAYNGTVSYISKEDVASDLDDFEDYFTLNGNADLKTSWTNGNIDKVLEKSLIAKMLNEFADVSITTEGVVKTVVLNKPSGAVSTYVMTLVDGESEGVYDIEITGDKNITIKDITKTLVDGKYEITFKVNEMEAKVYVASNGRSMEMYKVVGSELRLAAKYAETETAYTAFVNGTYYDEFCAQFGFINRLQNVEANNVYVK